MRNHRRQNNEPREMKARFNSICSETGRQILKGETIIYYPGSRQAFKTDSRQAQEFREMKQDDQFTNYSF